MLTTQLLFQLLISIIKVAIYIRYSKLLGCGYLMSFNKTKLGGSQSTESLEYDDRMVKSKTCSFISYGTRSRLFCTEDLCHSKQLTQPMRFIRGAQIATSIIFHNRALSWSCICGKCITCCTAFGLLNVMTFTHKRQYNGGTCIPVVDRIS